MLAATSHIQEKREDILEAREKQGDGVKGIGEVRFVAFPVRVHSNYCGCYSLRSKFLQHSGAPQPQK